MSMFRTVSSSELLEFEKQLNLFQTRGGLFEIVDEITFFRRKKTKFIFQKGDEKLEVRVADLAFSSSLRIVTNYLKNA